MTTMLDRIEEQLVDLFQRRQDVLDVGRRQRERRAEQERHRAEVREKYLPKDRELEQDWQQAYEDWLSQGLDLFDQRQSLTASIRAHYGRPRTSVHAELVKRVKAEFDRQQVLNRGPRDQTAARQEKRDHLRGVVKDLERSNRQQAHDRARSLRASLERQGDS